MHLLETFSNLQEQKLRPKNATEAELSEWREDETHRLKSVRNHYRAPLLCTPTTQVPLSTHGVHPFASVDVLDLIVRPFGYHADTVLLHSTARASS